MNLKKYLPKFILLLAILIGACFRFYKLDWGENYFFHPDEYHIVGAVERLNGSGLLTNPKLFSYGSSTVYLIYILSQFLNVVLKIPTNVFIVGRLLSALFSTLTLFNIYFISKQIFKKEKFFPILTVLTSAFTPGLIQQAHFLTPESFVTFWITLSVYFIVKFAKSDNLWHLIIGAGFTGIAAGTKISALAATPFTLLFLVFSDFKKYGLINRLQKAALYVSIVFVFFFAVFPYAILDYENFLGTTRYESLLSAGTQKVFYTRSFENSMPFIFQLTKIYPYTLGTTLTIISFVGLGIVMAKLVNQKKKTKNSYLMLIGIFASYLIFNSLLFTKWTRFVHTTIPFLAIFAVSGIYELQKLIKNTVLKKIFFSAVSLSLLIPTILYGLAFFTIYRRSDVRIMATNWIKNNVQSKDVILSESGNTLEVPLNGNYQVTPFDFYNLDQNPNLYNKLITEIERSDYFIIQSRRIYKNHGFSEFPIVSRFYDSVFSGRLGFREIIKFSSYPQLKLGNFIYEIDDGDAEETWTVFDHPVIRIFKKTTQYSTIYYETLLKGYN